MAQRLAQRSVYFSSLPDGEGEYLYKLLTKHGSTQGTNAFDKLCDLNCDPVLLGQHLVMFSQTEEIVLKRTGEAIPIRPLDSWDTALNGLSIDDLRQVTKRAKELQKDILRLKNTPLVRRLIRKGIIKSGDLLHGNIMDTRFDGLLKLPELASQYGPRQRPEYTERLTKIYEHIHERTRGWHDALLADILTDLMPDASYTEQALKEWRSRHGLKATRKPRK